MVGKKSDTKSLLNLFQDLCEGRLDAETSSA